MPNEKRSKIEIRAYEIWEREGYPTGKAMEHWYLAVAEVAREQADSAKHSAAKPKQTTDKADKNVTAKPKPASKTSASASKPAAAKKTKSEGKNATPKSKPKAATKKER
jgi:hypothetical protein